MTSMADRSGNTTRWTYQPNGWLQSRTLANGVTATYTHDAQGRLTNLANTQSNGTLSTFTVPATGGYDGVGNRLSVTANIPGASMGYSGTTSYQYDHGQTATAALNRSQLTGEANPRATSTYAYDGGIGTGPGNPTTFRGQANSFNPDNQRTTNSSYDGNGNTVGFFDQYDPENRPTDYGNGRETYSYYGDGLRAQKSGTYYLYDGDRPVCEYNSSGQLTATNVFGADGLILRRTSSSFTYYTFDERGNVAQRLNSFGTPQSTDAYDAYGARTSTASTQPDPWGYEAQFGYYTDTYSGYILCTHRYYDPQSGRFITRDPIGYDGGINIYGYTGNNPVNESDPSGFGTFILKGKGQEFDGKYRSRIGDPDTGKGWPHYDKVGTGGRIWIDSGGNIYIGPDVVNDRVGVINNNQLPEFDDLVGKEEVVGPIPTLGWFFSA